MEKLLVMTVALALGTIADYKVDGAPFFCIDGNQVGS